MLGAGCRSLALFLVLVAVGSARAQERPLGTGHSMSSCGSDLDCDLTRVCLRFAGPGRTLLRPGGGVCVHDTVDPTATLSGSPLYVGPVSDRLADPAVWVKGEVSDNRWVAKAWFALDGTRLPTRFRPGDTGASVDVSGVRLGPDRAHKVVLEVRDGAGNRASAMRVVIVDTRAPALTLVAEVPNGAVKSVMPADGLVFGTPSLRAGVRIAEPYPASGGFSVANTGYLLSHPGDARPLTTLRSLTLPEGAHPLSATITDLAGNTGTAAATIWVDLTPPVVTSRVVDSVISHCAPESMEPLHWIVDVEDLTATTIEVVSPGSQLGRFGPSSREIITELEPGPNVVTLIVTDAAGHETVFEQAFFVEGVPVDDGVGCTADHCDEVTGLVSHTGTNALCDDGDLCNGAESCDATLGCQDGPAPFFDDGNPCTVDTCDPRTGVVTHHDEEPPVLSLTGVDNGQRLVEVGLCTPDAVVTWGASATDCGGVNVAVTCSPESGTTFPLGTTVVTCSAADPAGNTTTGAFHVVVYDGPGAWELVPIRAQTWEAGGHAIGGAGVQATKAIAIAPTMPSRMAIGTDTARVLVSDNGGRDWIPRSDGINAVGVFSLAFDPDDEDVLYAAAMDPTADDDLGDGLYRSTDFGRSWQRVLTAYFPKFRDDGQSGEPPSSQTRWIAFGPTVAGQRTVYVATHDLGLVSLREDLISPAGSDPTWSYAGPQSSDCPLVAGPGSVEINVVHYEPGNDTLWLAGTYDPVPGETASEWRAALCYRAGNAAWGNAFADATWNDPLETALLQPASQASEVRDVVIHRDSPDHMSIALGRWGVFDSADHGETWSRVQGLRVGPIAYQGELDEDALDDCWGTDPRVCWDWAMLAVGAGSEPVLYADPDRTSIPVHASHDGGTTWSAPTWSEEGGGTWPGGFFGGPGTKAKPVTIHPLEANVAFNNNPIRVTRDGGVTWQLSNNGFDGARRGGGGRSAVAFDPVDPNNMMFFHIDQGATLTRDGGRTWSNQHAPTQTWGWRKVDEGRVTIERLNTDTQDGGVWDPASGTVVAAIGYYDDTRLCRGRFGTGEDADVLTWEAEAVDGVENDVRCIPPGGIAYDHGDGLPQPSSKRLKTTFGYFAMDPNDHNIVYVQRTRKEGRDGPVINDVLRIDSAAWTSVSVKEGLSLQAIDSETGVLYAHKRVGSNDGTDCAQDAKCTRVWSSANRGASWSPVGAQFPCETPRNIDVDDTHVYVGCSAPMTTGDGVWVFDGAAWTRRALATADGVSTVDSHGQRDFGYLAVDRRHDGIVYAAQRSVGEGHGAGIYRSRDHGQTWTNLNANLGTSINIWGVAVSPVDSSVTISTDLGSYRLRPDDLEAIPPTHAWPVIDDGNACTVDTCDPATGAVKHLDKTPPGKCCAPADGTLQVIEDHNPCTVDTCAADGQVTHVDVEAAKGCCNPFNGERAPLDDGVPCTTDVCDPLSGTVTHLEPPKETCCEVATGKTSPLDDHDGCTKDTCDPRTGAAVHAARDIDDGNACTVDACDTVTGAISHTDTTPAGACCRPSDGALTSIADDDACTNDVCDPATGLVTNPPRDIDDHDACTLDACDPATGAVTREPAPLFVPDAATVVYFEPAGTGGVPAEDLAFNADFLGDALPDDVEFVMDVPAPGATNVIVIHRPDRESPPDPYEVDSAPDFGQLPFEGFRVEVGPARIDVYAGDPRGQRYALQWLVDAVAGGDREWQSVCAQTLEDAPALRLRAFHPGNYGLDDLEAALDEVSAARLNVIQWHLRPVVHLASLGVAQGGVCPAALRNCTFAAFGQTVRVTKAGHGLETGTRVVVSGTTHWDGTWTITRVDVNRFTLDGAVWTPGDDNQGDVVVGETLPFPEPYADAEIQALLQAAAERHIVVVPSIKLLTHQEKLLASDELAADHLCPGPNNPKVTVTDRVEEQWPGMLLPKICPASDPDCEPSSRVYDPTYVFPVGATLDGLEDGPPLGGLTLYEGFVFPLLDELVARFSAVRPISAVVIGHDETVEGALAGLSARLAADGDPSNDKTPAQLFADDVLTIHDYLADPEAPVAYGRSARPGALWSVMWADMLLPAHDDPVDQIGLEVSLATNEDTCVAPPVYMEDAVHGDRDAIGVRDTGAFDLLMDAFCRHPDAGGDCVGASPRLRLGDWHYFHAYADFPSYDYLSALAPVYGASWHRSATVTAFAGDVVAADGPGMIATSWGLPAAYPAEAANLSHIIAFSGATYWTGGEPTEGRFGWEPRPNDVPGDSQVLMTRVACGDADDPGVVTGLFAPGDCGWVWVKTRDIAAEPDDEVDPSTLQGWEVEVGNGTRKFFASAPEYVPDGAPGAPAYTWRLAMTIPADATSGPYRVKVRYADAGWLVNNTVHDDALTVGAAVGDELVGNGGFQADGGWDIGARNHVDVSLSCDGGTTSCDVGDGERALCIAVDETSCSACTWTECGGGEACGCTYSQTWQRITLPEGQDRRFVLTYRLWTDGRHAAGPDEVRNEATVEANAFAGAAPECWPDKSLAGDVCDNRRVTGSVTTDDGWRTIEAVLAPSDDTTHLEVRPIVVNKGESSSGVVCYDDFSLREVGP